MPIVDHLSAAKEARKNLGDWGDFQTRPSLFPTNTAAAARIKMRGQRAKKTKTTANSGFPSTGHGQNPLVSPLYLKHSPRLVIVFSISLWLLNKDLSVSISEIITCGASGCHRIGCSRRWRPVQMDVDPHIWGQRQAESAIQAYQALHRYEELIETKDSLREQKRSKT